MEFAPSPKAQDLRLKLDAFMQHYFLPYNAAWHASVSDGIYPPAVSRRPEDAVARRGVVEPVPARLAALDGFASPYAGHIEVEENTVYPRSRALLDDTTLAAVSREMHPARAVLTRNL